MKKKGRNSRIPKFARPDTSQIETALIESSQIIGSKNHSQLRHPDQNESTEWTGADVRITSDFEWEPATFVEAHDLLVRTRHAKALTWLFLEIRDAFGLWLDAGNKYGFYGSLAEAALDHLARHQPEPEDARPLLRVVLGKAFQSVALLRDQGALPGDCPVVIHARDAEGCQRRIQPQSRTHGQIPHLP